MRTPSSYKSSNSPKYVAITSEMGHAAYTAASQKHSPTSLMPIHTAASVSLAVQGASADGAGTRYSANSPTCATKSVVTPVLMRALEVSAP